MVEESDWRLQGQEDYLSGVTLVHKRYRRYQRNPECGEGRDVREIVTFGMRVTEGRIAKFHERPGSSRTSRFLTLVHSTSTPSGVLLTRYARSGEVRTGAFEEV